MTFREILDALWRRRFLIEVAVVVSVLLGLGLVLMRGNEYRATAEVLFEQKALVTGGGEGLQTQQKLNLVVITLSRLVESEAFVNEALEAENIVRGGARVSAEAVQNTSIVRLTVASSTRGRTEVVAAAVAEHLREQTARDQADVAPDLRVTTRLITPPLARQTSANAVFAVIVALIAGLAISGTAALILESNAGREPDAED